MESREPDSDDINRETAEEQEEHGGRFDRESGAESSVVEGSEAVPSRTDIDEELEDRGDM
jgi:hypothetical protein